MTLPQKTTETVPAVCQMLRTKNAFAMYGDGEVEPWQSGASTTAVYWCLQTMQTAGPDDGFAHPDACREGRCCFKSRDP